MAITGKKAYATAVTYVKESLIGVGAIKGASCKIKSIVKLDGINKVTFEWETNNGETRESFMYVEDGTHIYVWVGGNHYNTSDFCVFNSNLYRCVIENHDNYFDEDKWEAIGSSDGNFDIVQRREMLPKKFTENDKKMYFVIEDGYFWLWDGTKWKPQNQKTNYTVTNENLVID